MLRCKSEQSGLLIRDHIGACLCLCLFLYVKAAKHVVYTLSLKHANTAWSADVPNLQQANRQTPTCVMLSSRTFSNLLHFKKKTKPAVEDQVWRWISGHMMLAGLICKHTCPWILISSSQVSMETREKQGVGVWKWVCACVSAGMHKSIREYAGKKVLTPCGPHLIFNAWLFLLKSVKGDFNP